jgi:glycyl-tRNA synthetase
MTQRVKESMHSMDKIVSLCKRRGFIFQSSEIYGGLASAWDYGPLGVELKRNVKNAWWKSIVHDRDDMVGLDASILMHPKVWEASGHVDGFVDLVVECKSCHKRMRLDELLSDQEIRDALENPKYTQLLSENSDNDLSKKLLFDRLISTEGNKKCLYCGERNFTAPRNFNLMLKTFLGPMEDNSSVSYLRPETAQGIFVNFQNVLDATSRKLPFGIAQIGKAFRNEVTTKNFIFRTREFEQMEIEYFTKPEDAGKCHESWIDDRLQWYLNLGMKKENLRIRPHDKNELAHYAKGCSDIEYNFPFGWSELEGIANRTDFDLKQHSQFSGKDLQYQDKITNEKYFPYVIEPSGGVDRATLAFLIDAYHEEEVEGKTRVVLRLSKHLAPIKVAVLPLLKSNNDIVELSKKIKQDLQRRFTCMYNDTAAIGKLYRRQDEVGTFYCVTVDVQSLEDKQVTVRDRDTMRQARIPVDNLKAYLTEQLSN